MVSDGPSVTRGATAGRGTPRPLLKWAGGKRQLLPVFRAFYPAEFGRYFEPFLGSGAVFFDLYQAGRLDGRTVELSDRNADLVGCYLAVRDRGDEVLAALADLAQRHALDGSACYYAVRERFNAARALLSPSRAATYTPALAAMLIYLNRTGFNGLFRLNARGGFNVPAGRYARPRVLNAGLLGAVGRALRAEGVRLRHCSAHDAVASAAPADFLYFDPPYVPVSETAGFGAYTAEAFTATDQRQLCETVTGLARAGCHVMLSNSSATWVTRLYEEAAGAGAGLALWQLPARRAINSRAAGRGHVSELLLTNLPPRGLHEAVRLC